jgi:hypothetical protein
VGENPTRQLLQPEATGAVMEVTKWLGVAHIQKDRLAAVSPKSDQVFYSDWWATVRRWLLLVW